MSDISTIHFDQDYSIKDSAARTSLSNKVDKVSGKELMPSDLIVNNKIATSYLPSTGTINDGTLTIQQNGTTIATFTANQAGNSTANIQTAPYIICRATNTEDGTTVVSNKANASITDSVSYNSLTPNTTYTLKTRVYNSTKGEYLTITKSGVSDVEISSTFTPVSSSSSYSNIFTANCSKCANDDVLNVIDVLYINSIPLATFSSNLSVYIYIVELGLRVDFRNSTFTRLGDAVGLSGGSDFDSFPMYQRRRCNLSDNGTVNAYLGDTNYAVDGSNGQVMVEQPKFYYKVVVPAPSESSKWIRYPNSPNEIEYWVSNQPLEGYKPHPAFKNTSLQEIDYFYEGAYEGYVSSSKLGSVSGVAPSSGSSGYKRADCRTYAANRGSGWRQETIWSISADQILMIIEYGKFNMQDALGYGCVNASAKLNTGTLNSYGNGSYGTTANQTTGVQWRGKENPWGNIVQWVDGLNLSSRIPFIANSYTFTDNTTINYTMLNFGLPISKTWISAFGYDSNFDWLMLPVEADSTYGNSATPVGDCAYATREGYEACRIGGYWNSGLNAGPFCWIMAYAPADYYSQVCGRLLYVG